MVYLKRNLPVFRSVFHMLMRSTRSRVHTFLGFILKIRRIVLERYARRYLFRQTRLSWTALERLDLVGIYLLEPFAMYGSKLYPSQLGNPTQATQFW